MKKLYSLLLLLVAATALGQSYTFTVFNTNNSGIAANNVNDFKQSSTGTLWIATNNGLSAMVGNNFTNYRTNNSTIPTNILSMIAVSGNNVWAGTYQQGLVYRNGTTGAFTHYTTSNSNIPNNFATGIATDSQGNLWMGSPSGLTKFNGTTWTTYNSSNSQLCCNDVTSVAVDASNNVWISAGGMLMKFNGTTFTTITDGVMKILKVTPSAIYVNTGDGLGKIVNNNFTNLYYTNSSCLASCAINTAGVDETNKVWLGLDTCGNYEGGLQNFTNCITYTTSNSALPHNSISSMHIVDSNVIWVGTLEEGLVRMNKTDNPPCVAPTGLNVAQFGQNSAYLAWNAANPAPANGYIYRYSTVNNVNSSTVVESSTSQNGAGIDQLQPNTTYYWWVASACEPLTWVSGGSFTTLPAPVCAAPTQPYVAQFGQTTAQLAWTAANPAPSGGYLYRYNTVNNVNGSTAVSSSTSQTGAGIDQLQPNTTYYWWVASACEPLTWVAGGSFTTQAAAPSGCTTAPYGLYPTAAFTPSCTGSNESIVTDAWAGEYSNVNVLASKQYIFTSSVATDYITITNTDGTTVLASGQIPLTWTSATAGVIRYYLHANANCGTQNSARTRSIRCDAATTCGLPTALSITNITSNSCRMNWTAPATAPNAYDLYIVTTNTAPTANTAATVTSTTAGIGVLSGVAPATTYYYWIRSNCGGLKSAWVSGGSFTTIAALSCNGASNGLYPNATFTPSCSGTNEQIATDAFAGEYANVNAVTNRLYTFTSSVATDYITITNAAGTTVLASGQTPLTWTSGNTSGVIRYYLHANSTCGSQETLRTRSIKCAATAGSEEFEMADMKYYPNPVSDVLHVSYTNEIKAVAVYNLMGQEVMIKAINATEGTVNVSNLAAGTYLVKVTSGDEVKTIKVIKK